MKKSKRGGFQLTPKAYRLFQNKLLQTIFSQLQESRSGRHTNVVVGEGAVEMQSTKPYEFGDSVANLDIPQSLINAMLRNGPASRCGWAAKTSLFSARATIQNVRPSHSST